MRLVVVGALMPRRLSTINTLVEAFLFMEFYEWNAKTTLRPRICNLLQLRWCNGDGVIVSLGFPSIRGREYKKVCSWPEGAPRIGRNETVNWMSFSSLIKQFFIAKAQMNCILYSLIANYAVIKIWYSFLALKHISITNSYRDSRRDITWQGLENVLKKIRVLEGLLRWESLETLQMSEVGLLLSDRIWNEKIH